MNTVRLERGVLHIDPDFPFWLFPIAELITEWTAHLC